MSNHPNRGPKGPASNPQPEEIVAARSAVTLTQREASRLVHSTEAAWRSWESGLRRMPPGLWELFNLKAGWPNSKGRDMDNLNKLLDTIITENPQLTDDGHRVWLASIARGYRLMKRYGRGGGTDAPAPGPGFDEWFAGNALYANACNHVREIIGDAEREITRKIVAFESDA